jgi:hypothetical protein
MPEKTNEGQSGGVTISGSVGSVGGDIIGRDKITRVSNSAEVEAVLRPIEETIKVAHAEVRPDAIEKFSALKSEVAKGKDANDRTVADLVDGLVKLVPGAVSAVVGAFATPILGGVVGPVTGFVLDKLRGK